MYAAITRLAYRSAGPGLAFYVILMAVTTWCVWDAFPHGLVLSWLGVVFTCTAVRICLHVAFRRRAPSDAEIPRWRTLFEIGVACSAIGWGFAVWTFLATDQVIPRLLVITFACGLNAGAARALAAVPRCA